MREILPRHRALKKKCFASRIMPQEAYRAVAVPKRESISLMIRLVIFGRDDFQNSIRAGRSDIGMRGVERLSKI